MFSWCALLHNESVLKQNLHKGCWEGKGMLICHCTNHRGQNQFTKHLNIIKTDERKTQQRLFIRGIFIKLCQVNLVLMKCSVDGPDISHHSGQNILNEFKGM